MVCLFPLTAGAACCCRFAILTSRAFTKLLEASCCHRPLATRRGPLHAACLAVANAIVLGVGAGLGAHFGPLPTTIATIFLEMVSALAKVHCSTLHLLAMHDAAVLLTPCSVNDSSTRQRVLQTANPLPYSFGCNLITPSVCSEARRSGC